MNKKGNLIRFLLVLQTITLILIILGSIYLYQTRWIVRVQYTPKTETLSLGSLGLTAANVQVLATTLIPYRLLTAP